MNSIEKALNDLQNAVKDELGVQTQLLSAVDAFRVLLKEQLDRVAHMSSEKVDFTQKEVVTIRSGSTLTTTSVFLPLMPCLRWQTV